MIFVKNLSAIAAIFFGVASFYLALTVPVFVASSYLMLAMFCAGVTALSSWTLSNTNKLWLAVFGVLWSILLVASNGAV